MTRLRALTGFVVVVAAASVAAWSLAYPQASLAMTLVRAVADCTAVTTLGLAVVPMLDDERYRGELLCRATAPLTAAAAVWLVAELSRLIVAAAQSAAVTVGRLGVRSTVEFASSTAAGRAGVLCAVAAAAVCAVAVGVPRLVPANIVVAGLAAVGIGARSLTGHFFESAVGGVAVAVHTLAAALWCGTLAGLVLTVGHRGQWARVLPRFSQLSLWCVLMLLVGGVVGAASRLGSPADVWATGYGRVLAAKVVVIVVLIALGRRNRGTWLPAARTHRATAVVSRGRSLAELAVMAVALALAAALATTG